ncbi:hypothetical protein V8F63_14240 [Brevundimonas sp. LF-1]|uniref:hypothetical protein n=1 Tax=Brevundimonas sp. LF-1 TaxID=3126100 RepID=UPI0030DDF28F
MVDLTTEMAGLWAALGPAPAHRGRVILFAAATSGEGVSTVAREFARMAAVRGRRPVWLIDGDLSQQGQMEQIAAEPDRFGAWGRLCGRRRTGRPSTPCRRRCAAVTASPLRRDAS